MKVVISRVDDIADQIRGVTYRKQDAATSKMNGFLPVLRAGNITDQGLTYEDLVYVPASKISEKQKIRKHDVLIAASSGSLDVVGKAAPVLEDFEGGFGAFCKVLRPRKNVDPAYFAQFFKTPEYRRTVSSLAAGANINNLRNEDLDGLQIPLPPLAEQKRIAAILDAADALRAKRRETLAQLDTLLQSTFLDMFGDPVANPKGWEVSEFGSCIKDGPRNGLSKTKDFLGQGFPLLDNKGLYRSMWADFSEIRFIQLSKKELDRHRVVDGDIIVNRVSVKPEGVGLPVLVRGAPPDCVFESNMMRITPDTTIVDPIFLVSCLRTEGMRRQTINAANLANQASINQVGLCTIKVILPPLPLQRRFATIVESVEQQKTRLRAHLAELDTLFASLQDRAFKGAL